MGLDVSWYRGLTKVENPPRDADGYLESDEFVQFSPHPDFPGRCDEFNGEAAYTYEEADGFRAGSYGGYNGWRSELARIGGYEDGAAWRDEVTEGPFYELVNFSDCEGTIGTAVSAKLAKDFATFQAKADAIGGLFKERYDLWRNAFEQAAQGGAVDLH